MVCFNIETFTLHLSHRDERNKTILEIDQHMFSHLSQGTDMVSQKIEMSLAHGKKLHRRVHDICIR